MNLPKILVIDDQFGQSLTDRRNLCINFGLVDISGDDAKPAKIKKPVAEAVFCRGQRVLGNKVLNDTDISIDAISKGWPHTNGWFWSMVLLDIRFVSGQIEGSGEPAGQDGDMDFGKRILDDIKHHYPELPVVMLSSRERKEVIEDCRNRGASDFIQWGQAFESKTPREILHENLFQHGLLPDNRKLKKESDRIMGNSLPLLLALRSARRGATGSGNILIIGETGSGKELLAKYAHDMSPKSKGPYKIFHPFRTADTLREDELFGHSKGSFTGATSEKEGLFEVANGGTLFIDEIGDIPESLQLKLLRPLENRAVLRQGTDKEVHLDLQIVLATNKNLDEYARTGKFKSDLLNRINAYTITLPPLRERKEDIPSIARHLLSILCEENSARWPREIKPEAMELLKNYEWPDNVRGLRNVLERVVKDNKDADLVVPSDIRFDTSASDIPEESKTTSAPQSYPSGLGSIDILIKNLKGFEFPGDYDNITGKLPALREAVAILLANYLLSALGATKKKKPGNLSELELNITGAASCMMGKQLKTPKAADVIKKVLQTDKAVLKKILDKNPHLQSVYNDVLRLRPTNPKGPKKDKDDN